MKTSVECLAEQLIPNVMRMFDPTTRYAIEQAKEMENQRLKYAYEMGREGKTIEEFNETFKSE
jgi:CRISPR/Cas system CSM-associated protein Csm2 small subunit